ncbi:MAG: hypothetical protein GW938_02380 [Leptospira sp.]|nr:hypothetical protein [Leptospira sp.]NCS94831.1 hypothetical protein [Leptospira sp.]
MLKDRVVFTNKGWSVFNSEFIFDALTFFLFSSIQIGLVYFGFFNSLISLAAIFIPYIGFYAIHRIYNKYVYLLGLLIHILFLELVLPVQWMSPLWLGLSCVIGLGIYSFFQHYLSIRFPYFLLPMAVLLLSSRFVSIDGISIDSSSMPWVLIEGWTAIDYQGLFGLNQYSLLESFSIYALSLSALFIFRRLLSLNALFWILIISVIPYYKNMDSLPYLSIATQANVFFLACLMPGSSVYSSFWVKQITWLIILSLQIILVTFQFTVQSLGFLMILFFMVEGFFLKFFHASRPMKGNKQ